MAFGEEDVREPEEYGLQLQRIRTIDDALEQHNAVVELLKSAHNDRARTAWPKYDAVIAEIEAFERESGDRLARG